MKKSTLHRLPSVAMSVMAIAFAVQSCASGEMPGGGGSSGGSTGNGSGGSSARTGGSTGTPGGGTGGSSAPGTGGSFTAGTGGSFGGGTGGSAVSGSGGFPGFGSGGAAGPAGTGGAVVIGGGTGGASTGTPGAFSAMAGFATNGTWKGYAYTAVFPPTSTTVTIAPACPTPCFAGTTVCAMGSVPADPTYASGALLGWNINQELATTMVSPPIGTIATTGTGLAINVSGSGAMRVQIQSGTTNWCANLTATGNVMIPWTMFNTMCWNPPMGMPFSAGTPISAIQIVVPSGAAAIPFNFCLMDAKPY